MVVYVVVILAVLLMLVGSYRALSGGVALSEEDERAVIASILRHADGCRQELDAAFASAPPEPGDEDALAASAVAGRKRLAALQQQLGRLDGGRADDLDRIRTLLSAAIEDLGWACRLVEPGTYRDNPGVRAAVGELRDHGGRCLDAASALAAAIEASAALALPVVGGEEEPQATR